MYVDGTLPEDYAPRWCRTKAVGCCVPTCTSTARVTKHNFQWGMICDCIGIHGSEVRPKSLALCLVHYASVHRLCNPEKAGDIFCKICGVRRKHERKDTTSQRFVSCPKPEMVELHLRDCVDFDSSLSEGDLVCSSCYRYCQHVLNLNPCEITAERVVEQLQEKQALLETQVSSFDPSSNASFVELALLKTAIYLNRNMLKDRALLFPRVYQYFQSCLPDPQNSEVCVSKSRVLTYLGNEFGTLVSSTCCHRKIGTVFYRTKSDPYLLLSHALSECGEKGGNSANEFSSNLNSHVHQLASHMLNDAYKDDRLAHVLDVDTYVEYIQASSPEVWEHVCKLTQSVNEGKGRKAAVSEHSQSGRIKLIRRAYLVSVLLFTTNTECCYPFHVQLADAVESSGGTCELITLLNRVGATASVPTLKRHIQTISEARKDKGLQGLLPEKAFTVASTDNIDFLQSHAAVYCGSQHRSWHATSVQLVQPRPLTCKVESLYPQVGSESENDPNCARRRLLGSDDPTSSGTPSFAHATDDSQHSQPVAPGPDPTTAYNPLRAQVHRLVRQKRVERASPINSPQKQTRSPCPKRFKRARTSSEACKLRGSGDSPNPTPRFRSILPCPVQSQVQFEAFKVSLPELKYLNQTGMVMFQYMCGKEALGFDNVLMELKAYFGHCAGIASSAEKSNVVYLPIVDKHADSLEAMEEVVSKLNKEFQVGISTKHLILAGDQKTFARLWELKHVYGTDLDWLIPFIGDWHLLKNYQSVLMKVYYDAGLRELAEAAGFRGETLTSLSKCSNFKRTHHFLLQSWEALYRHMLSCYVTDSSEGDSDIDILSVVRDRLVECDLECLSAKSYVPLLGVTGNSTVQDNALQQKFLSYLSSMASADTNWRFWKEFVFRDAYSYICLFLSIRGGVWKLRNASIKKMAPLFTAFDRPHYRKLIPQHLKDLQTMPEEVKQFFESGAFVCSISGSDMNSVALDEAHETLINKDIKTSVVRPTKEYLDRILYYFPVRSKALNKLKDQLLVHRPDAEDVSRCSLFNHSVSSRKVEENIVSMRSRVSKTNLLSSTAVEQGLISFSGRQASPEQAKDLLSFWDIGQEHFEAYIRYFIIRQPSAKVPLRLARLLTFSSSRRVQRKIKLIEKERKIVNRCMRRKMAWNAKLGFVEQPAGG